MIEPLETSHDRNGRPTSEEEIENQPTHQNSSRSFFSGTYSRLFGEEISNNTPGRWIISIITGRNTTTPAVTMTNPTLVENIRDDVENPPPTAVRPATPPPTPPTPTTTTNEPAPEFELRRTLSYIMTATKSMAFLTLWQLLSASRTEHIQLLSLLSLLVPWAGFEGAKERNRALLSVFHSLCFVYIPLNVFHAYAHAQNVQYLLEDDNYSESVKNEIRASGSAFLGVTILLIIDMSLCIMWTRKVMRAHLILLLTQHEHAANEFAAAQQATHGGSTSGLSSSDFSMIDSHTVVAEDASKDVCVICQDAYLVGEICRKLPCRHEFHSNCVDQWFQRSSLCPICNANIHVMLAQAQAPGDVV